MILLAGCSGPAQMSDLHQDLAMPLDLSSDLAEANDLSVPRDLAERDFSGDLSFEPDLARADLSHPDLGGLLMGMNEAQAAGVDLTGEGDDDWVHWGRINEASVDRKLGALLLAGTVIGAAPLHQYTNSIVSYSWSDGTPTASNSGTSSGIYVLGEGNGFRVTAPADRTRRSLRVYLSAYGCDFRVTAHLSDGSDLDFVEDVLNGGSSTSFYRRYRFDYSAAGNGETLTVTWTDVKDQFGGGNVTLESATLQ